VDFGFPKMLILATATGSTALAATCAASYLGSDLVPSYTNFVAALGSDVIVINDIANGVKITEEVQEISGADTSDNLPDYVLPITGITGNLKTFNLSILNYLEQLNCHTRLYLWYVTNTGWCFGGQTGYLTPNYWKDWEHPGYGPNRSMIPVSFKWNKPLDKQTGAMLDTDYLNLVNT
jgi:hypothetical protein